MCVLFMYNNRYAAGDNVNVQATLIRDKIHVTDLSFRMKSN
jgi:hypothetical protein